MSTIEDDAIQRLAWRAIAMAHSFMSHVKRIEDGGQWEEAQREVLRSAQSSGKLQAGLVHATRAPTSKGAWSEALERDIIARELLKAEIAKRSDAYAEEGAEGLGFYMHGMWGFFDIPEHL